MVCTESKLDETVPSNILIPNGFHEPLGRDINRVGVGTLIYISQSLACSRRQDLEEQLWVDIKVNNQICCINAYYRRPSDLLADKTRFLDTTESLLRKINNHKHDNTIIASDLTFGNCYCKYPILTPKPLDSCAPDIFEEFGMIRSLAYQQG